MWSSKGGRNKSFDLLQENLSRSRGPNAESWHAEAPTRGRDNSHVCLLRCQALGQNGSSQRQVILLGDLPTHAYLSGLLQPNLSGWTPLCGGGCSQQGQPLDTLEMLDVVSHKWIALPPMPTPRAGAAAVMLGKEVLVIGGVDSTQRPLASVEVYHTDEGRWEKKADLAQASMGISALEKDGLVYALGGMGADTSPQALLQLYEPTKDHWQSLPSMPTPCYGASTFLHGNKIYVMGGRQGKLPVTAFEAFDLEVRSWTRYPSVPSRRAFASCAMAEGCFFSLGGLQQPGPHNFYSRPHFVNTVEMFDLEEGSWSRLSRAIRMRDKRADFVAGHLGGRVIVAGGLGNQSSPLGSAEGFNLAKKKWETLPAMPTGRCSSASLEAPNLLFVIGGVAQGPSSAVEALSLQEEV